jgi:GAF domain-containing protein
MRTRNYLTPFVEVGRALCDGADAGSVMHLVARRITGTLGLKGCVVKTRGAGESLESLSACGLTEHFLFGLPDRSSESICFQIPPEARCWPDPQSMEAYCDFDLLMVEGIRSVAVVPVDIRQEPVGMIALFSGQTRTFTADDLNFAAALASQGILAVFRQRELETALEKGRQYLDAFEEITRAVHSSLSAEEVLKLAAEKVSRALGAKGCAIRLLDSVNRELYLAYSDGLSEEFIGKGPVDAHKSISENLCGRVVVIEDAALESRLQYPRHVIDEGIRKIMSVPLVVSDNVIGVLRLYTGERPQFADHEIRFAMSVGRQCAQAIENAKIHQRIKHGYQQLMVDAGYTGSS